MAATQDIVRVEKASEWAEKIGITTWTKFHYKSEPEQQVFKPLDAWGHSLRQPFYGSIIGSPETYFLAVGWQSQEEWDRFQTSPEYQELMASLTTDSVQPETKIIVFSTNMFGMGFTSHVEIFTAYWPTSVTRETQDAIRETQKLVHTPAGGIPKPTCYRWRPSFGWIDGHQDWNGEKVVASVWCNKWKNEELEHKFKSTQKRMRLGDSGMDYPLALDAFKDDLKSLGAIGWESVYVAFERIRVVKEDSTIFNLRRIGEVNDAQNAADRLERLEISQPSGE